MSKFCVHTIEWIMVTLVGLGMLGALSVMAGGLT